MARADVGRPWRAPNYNGQSGALGWTPQTFVVPAGLEQRVHFWIDIYSKYTTHQGVIHDSENLSTIYEVVDFKEIELSGLPLKFQEKLKQRLVDDAKKRVLARFKDSGLELSRLRFQLGQKDRMATALESSGRYLPDFEKIFREAGLPIELTRLVFVESSFNVMARSKVGASGLWQLMRGTVRPYRIMNPAVDGRNHPLVATKMAARILADNFRRLGSWPLALTAYNHGATGVAHLVEKTGTREIGELVQSEGVSRSFGFASKNFYASFLAALEVERNAGRYFPGLTWAQPLDGESLKLPKPIRYRDLLGWFEGNDRLLQLMNPHLTTQARKGYEIPRGTPVSIPASKFDLALTSLSRIGRRPASVAGAHDTSPGKDHFAK